MIKKILDWILGKNDEKVKPAEVTSVETTAIHHQIDKIDAESKPTVETAPAVVVKTKYKVADLEKMKKAELEALVKKHKLEIKSRSTKSQLISALAKV